MPRRGIARGEAPEGHALRVARQLERPVRDPVELPAARLGAGPASWSSPPGPSGSRPTASRPCRPPSPRPRPARPPRPRRAPGPGRCRSGSRGTSRPSAAPRAGPGRAAAAAARARRPATTTPPRARATRPGCPPARPSPAARRRGSRPSPRRSPSSPRMPLARPSGHSSSGNRSAFHSPCQAPWSMSASRSTRPPRRHIATVKRAGRPGRRVHVHHGRVGAPARQRRAAQRGLEARARRLPPPRPVVHPPRQVPRRPARQPDGVPVHRVAVRDLAAHVEVARRVDHAPVERAGRRRALERTDREAPVLPAEVRARLQRHAVPHRLRHPRAAHPALEAQVEAPRALSGHVEELVREHLRQPAPAQPLQVHVREARPRPGPPAAAGRQLDVAGAEAAHLEAGAVAAGEASRAAPRAGSPTARAPSASAPPRTAPRRRPARAPPARARARPGSCRAARSSRPPA